jgi:hypothetical protein
VSVRANEIARKYGYGSAKKVLLVGGRSGTLIDTITANLAGVGIEVAAHWECEMRKPIPVSIDTVVLLTDTAANKAATHVKYAAAQAEVPIVATSRKWSKMAQALVAARMIKPEMLVATRAIPDPHYEEEVQVADKPAVEMQIRSVPETFDQRATQLKTIVTRLFEQDGFTSIMVTRDEGKIRIEIERSEKRVL